MVITHLFDDIVTLQEYMQGNSPDFDIDQDMNLMAAAHPMGVRITLQIVGVE